MSDLDRLTLDQLYDLHQALNEEGQRLHDRYMGLDRALSDEACILLAQCSDVSDTMGAVYVEIQRRQAVDA